MFTRTRRGVIIMKLKEQKWTDKDGNEHVKYVLGKLNEYGEGITVDTKINFQLSFNPNIKDVPFTDNEGKQKTFTAVNILAVPDVQFENVVMDSQYNNASFQLPAKYGEWITNCQKGDVITVWLRSFEDNNGKKKCTWDCDINGVNVKKKEQPTQTQLNGQESTIPPAVQAVVDTPKNPFSIQKDSPSNKTPDIPEELKAWAEEVVKNKEQFYEAFCDENVLKGVEAPLAFMAWIKNPEHCDTDYIAKIESKDNQNAKIAGLFWGLIAKFEGND